MSKIDLTHLNRNVLQYTYDIETMYNLFTIAFINQHSLTFMVFGDSQFDKYSDEYFIEKMKDYVRKPTNLEDLGINSVDDLDYYVIRAYENDTESITKLVTELGKIIFSKPMSHDMKYTLNNGYDLVDFSEYQGWNSFDYDTNMLILTYLYLTRSLNPKPKDIRGLSDKLIHFRSFPYKRYEYMEIETGGIISEDTYRLMFNKLIYSDGHIDWARVIKSSGDDATDTLLVPALKREMARFGKDIIVDDTVTISHSIEWSKEDVELLVEYNFNDVLGTRVIGNLPFIQTQLQTRDTLRKDYPYTSARSMNTDLLYKYEPASRDITASKLAALVIGGERRLKPQDTTTVQYEFPVPDGKGGEKQVDLWEYMKENESYVHSYLDTFFSHFRGQDTRDAFDDMKVKHAQPITRKGLMNVPYYDEHNQPLDCMIRVSTGGAHGGEWVGLSKLDDEEVKEWIKVDAKKPNSAKATIDLKDIIHIDWSSFYPTMASKMKMYMTPDGVDRYVNILNGRIEIKSVLKRLASEGKFGTDEYNRIDQTQDAQKFVLNNLTGEGNTHKEYAKVPLDNRTLSMRLIGNMLIWCMGQRLARKGAFIISTNTDGLYISGITLEESQEVIDEYVKIYGMPVSPEPIKRFINRDVSTRGEGHYDYLEPTVVSGDLGNAQKTTFEDSVVGRNLTYPLISGHAVVRYIFEDENWLYKPYDRERMKSYILDEYNNETFNAEAWYYIYSGTKSRRLLVDGIIQDKVARLILTRNGRQLGNETSSQLPKQHSINVYNQLMSGKVKTFNDIIDFSTDEPYMWSNIDGDAKVDDYRIDFVLNENRGKSNKKAEYQNVGFSGVFINDPKEHPYAILGFYDEETDIWEPLKRWSESKLTHFTSTVGVSLPLREDLKNFNKEDIDIGAYLDWAETILDTWKITNDIPHINMKKHDDTVLPPSRSTRKPTKRERGIDLLWSMYGFDAKPVGELNVS